MTLCRGVVGLVGWRYVKYCTNDDVGKKTCLVGR